MNSIYQNVSMIKYYALIIMDETIGGDYRIIIQVKEEEE